MKYSQEFIDATRAELDRLVAPIRDAWPDVVALVDVLRRAGVDVDLPDLTAPQEDTPPPATAYTTTEAAVDAGLLDAPPAIDVPVQRRVCGSVMVGSGTDTYDPTCELPAGHDGPCKSSAATDQHRIESVRPEGDDDALPSPTPAAPRSSSQADAPPASTAPATPPAPPTPAPKARKSPSRNPGADRMREIARERDDTFFAALPDDGSWISLADIGAKTGYSGNRITDAKQSLLDAGRIVQNDKQRAGRRVRRADVDVAPGDVSTTPLVGVAARKKAATLKAQAKARAGLDDAAIRDVILTLSQRPAGMTRQQLQKRLGIDKDSAVEILRRYLERKIICAVPDERDGAEARYRYVKEMPKGPTSRPKHRPDVAAAAMRAAGLPVPGTGTASGSGGKVTSDKNIQQFLDECVRAGGSYEPMNGGHIRVIGPKGFSVVAKTAGSSNLDRTRASVKSHTGLAI